MQDAVGQGEHPAEQRGGFYFSWLFEHNEITDTGTDGTFAFSYHHLSRLREVAGQPPLVRPHFDAVETGCAQD